MSKIKINKQWFKKIFPEGIKYPSSTIISGKGGSGKPLVELAFVAEWIRMKKPVIGIPLQYPSAEFVHLALDDLFGLKKSSYNHLMTYIHFKPELKQIKRIKKGDFEANLLENSQWEQALKLSLEDLKAQSKDVLLFGAAFNLLLFSPKYKETTFKRVKNFLNSKDHSFTILISVSTSALYKDIKNWEDAADNLLYTEMDKNKNLWLYAERMRYDKFNKSRENLPISKKELIKMREIAGKSRDRIIPQLRKIK